MPAPPFVGRHAQLALLRQELASAAQGSRIALVVGEAGIGKTRLLAELAATARSDAIILSGRGMPLGSTLPFGMLAEAIDAHLLGLSPSSVVRLCGSHIGRLAAVLPTVASAYDGDPVDSGRLGTLAALAALLAAVARTGPLVVILDDLHQADPSTWELIGYLARNQARAHVLLVAGLRPEGLLVADGLASVLVREGLALEVRLGALDVDAVAGLAAAVLPSAEVTDDLVGWLYDRSRGNALFAVALLADLATDPTRRVVPISVSERTRALVVALPAAARDVLETAAVLGTTFSLDGIAALVPAEQLRSLDTLTEQGLLVHRPDTLSYDFVHPLVQEAVYDNVGAVRRRELHRQIAALLADAPIGVRAYHAARGAAVGDSHALATVVGAAREARARAHHREAVAYLQAALALLPAGAVERRELLDELAAQASEIGDHSVGIPALRELRALYDLTGQSSRAADARMRLASLLAWGAADVAAAETEARAAVEGAGSDPALLPALTNELAWIRGAGGDLPAQIEGARLALTLARAAGDVGIELHALGSLGHALSVTGDAAEAAVVLDRSCALAEQLGSRTQLDWHAGGRAEALGFAGRLVEAADTAAAYEQATGGSVIDLPPSRHAYVLWLLGRWPEALACCRRTVALNPSDPPAHSAWVLSLAALIETARGRFGVAAPYLAQAERIYSGRDLYWFSARHDWAVGYAAALAGDTTTALERLRRAADRFEVMGALVPLALALPDLVELLVDTGELSEATACVDRGRALVDRLEQPLFAAGSQYAVALVARADDREHEAAAAFGRATELAGSCGARFLRARALERCATVESLAAAIRCYAELGATVPEIRATAALRRLGPVGRRAAQATGTLTPREREIVGLVRDGLSTPDIARRLYISDRTVETHLAHAYRKLQVSSRQDLAATTGTRLS